MTLIQKTRLFILTLIMATSGIAMSAAKAQTVTGQLSAYLSAHQAALQQDYTSAATYLAALLETDPDNLLALAEYLEVLVSKGDVKTAISIAERLEALDGLNETARLVLSVAAMKTGDFKKADDFLKPDGEVEKKFQQRLLRGWTTFGAGDIAASDSIFQNEEWTGRAKLFGLYNKALTLAVSGDFEGARVLFSGEGSEEGSIVPDRGGNIAYAQILYKLGRGGEAVTLLNSLLGGTVDQELVALRDAIAANQPVEYDYVTTAQQGAAQVFLSLSAESRVFAKDILTYGRLSQYLRPDYVPTLIGISNILRDRGQLQLAGQTLRDIPREHPMFLEGEILRADILHEDDKTAAAIEVLNNLARSHPNTPRVQMSLGDVFRMDERYAEAHAAYIDALAQIDTPQANHWALYFYLGVSAERIKKWDEAEGYLRKSLELSADNPAVLNYLGYSLVERGTNLEEAQKMIESASKQRPNDGYITDSLAWVLYRLGKFEQAVAPMEHAATLLPADPIVNDHLGDIYWQVGRKREAYFQWQRALNFEPLEADIARIQQKLDLGLDAVLKQEEEASLKGDAPATNQ